MGYAEWKKNAKYKELKTNATSTNNVNNTSDSSIAPISTKNKAKGILSIAGIAKSILGDPMDNQKSMLAPIAKKAGDVVQNSVQDKFTNPKGIKANSTITPVQMANSNDRSTPFLLSKNLNINLPTKEDLNVRNSELSSNTGLPIQNKKKETWGDKAQSVIETLTDKNEWKNAVKDVGKIGNQVVSSVKKTAMSVPYSIETMSLNNSDDYRRISENQGYITNKTKFQNELLSGNNEAKLPRAESKVQSTLHSAIQKENENIQTNIESANSNISKKLLELTPSITQSAIGGAMSMVNPGLGTAFFTTSAYTDYYDEAKSRGMTDKEAHQFGTVMGFWESLGDTIITGGQASRIKKAWTGQAINSKILESFGMDIFENAVQEGITEPIQELVATISGGKESSDWSNMGSRMFSSALDGALTAVIQGGATAGLQKSGEVYQKLQNKQNLTEQEIKSVVEENIQVRGKKIIENEILQSSQKVIEQTQNIINSQENIENKGQNNQNAPLLQSNRQITQTENKMAQNGNMEQIKANDIVPQKLQENNYKNQENASVFLNSVINNDIDVNSKEINTISKVLDNGNIKAIFDANAFTEKEANAGAKFLNDGTIIFNPNTDTKKGLFDLAIHEIGHAVSTEELNNKVLSIIQQDGRYQEMFESVQDRYKEFYSDKDSIQQEMVMDWLGENLSTEKYMNRLAEAQSKNDQTGIRKIISEFIENAKRFFKEHFGKDADLRKIENMFYDAFVSENRNVGNEKFSIQTDNNGNKYVRVDTDQDIFNGVDKKDYNKIAKMYIQDYLIGKTSLSNNDIATIDGRSAKKYTNPGNTQYKFEEKMRLTPELKNALKISQKISQMAPVKANSKYSNWEYYKFNFSIDGKNFEGLINIGIDTNGNKHFYEINNIKETRISGTSLNNRTSFSTNNSIAPISNNVNGSTKYSMQESEKNTKNSEKGSFSIQENKQRQLDIIKNNNPMQDDYHTGIRSVEDIKTFEEAIKDDESFVYGDYSLEDAQRDLEKGTVTVYSSKPIENGGFVSTSQNMARDYAGSGKIYSKEVSIDDVAWINGDEGQYAKINSERYSQTREKDNIWDRYLKETSRNKETRKTVQEIKLPIPESRFQDVINNAEYLPKEEKETLLNYIGDLPKTSKSLKEFESFVNAENNNYKKLDDDILSKKTYNTGRKEIYQKYLKSQGEYDNSSIKTAKELVKANYQGRRTKGQWLSIARQLGTEIANKSNSEIEEIAFRTWQDERPNSKDSLNRQGEKFVEFNSDEWIDTIYGAVKEQRERFSISDNNKIAPVIKNENNTKNSEKSSFSTGEKTLAPVAENANLTTEGKRRKHYESIMKSQYTSEEAKSISKELMGTDTYVPETNEGQLREADQRIKISGVDSELNSLMSRAINGEKISSVDIAVGERLIQYFSKIGDKENLQNAIQATAMAGTSAGQAVQAFSLLNHQTPEGMAIWIQRSIEKMNKDLAKRKGGIIEKNEDGSIRIVTKTGKDITNKVDLFNLTPDMLSKITNSTKENLQENLNEVYEELGQQVAKDLQGKIDSWRYFAMLANPTTHVRNIVGNIAMGGTQSLKNEVAGVIEGIVSKFNPKMERTHTIVPASDEVIEFAKDDIKNVEDRLGLNNDKYNPKSRLENSMRTFKSDVLENTLGKAFDLNSQALEAEDGWGLKAGYRKALVEYMTANKLTPQNITDKQLGKARNYAIEQAKEATFHQECQLASLVNQLSNRNKYAKATTDAILPFVKTPMNVARAGAEYSPLGLVKSIIFDTAKVRKGDITVNKYIDNISKGLTGSGIALVGYALAQMGILKASGEDDDKLEKFEEEQGKQSYSIQIGDNTYSLDWLAPAGIPLFIGAEIAELANAKKQENKSSSNDENSLYNQALSSSSNLLNALANAMNPMTEMSMLSGLTSALQSYEQGSSQMIASIVTNAGKSYTNQFFPTVLSKLAKTTDEYERSTTSTKTGVMSKAIDSTKNQVMSKIPGLREQLPIKTNIWGEEQKTTENVGLRTFENFVAPYTRKKVVSDNTNKELTDLYDKTGETSILPGFIDKTFNIDGQKYRYTSTEYNDAKKEYGQIAKNMLDDLVESKEYSKLSSEQKVDAIEKVYKYSKEKVKKEYADENNLELKTSTLYDTVDEISRQKASVLSYLEYTVKTKDMKKDSEKMEYLSNMQTDSKTKEIIYLSNIASDSAKEKYEALKIIAKSNSISEYLKFQLSDKESDREDDETEKGKAIKGSREEKVLNTINSLNLNNIAKTYLYATEYNLNTKDRRADYKVLLNYIKTLSVSEQNKIAKTLNGATKMKDGSYSW